MNLDYSEIGRRIAHRRKLLGLKQSEVEEKAGIGYKYLSNIERGISIPSIEVIMRLSIVLGTTPDEFLVGTIHHSTDEWKDVAQLLQGLSARQLSLTKNFLSWITQQDL